MSSTTLSDQLTSLKDKLAQSKAQINTRFFGQERVVDQVLTTMLAGGHAVLVGVPGVGKTRLVETMATVMGVSNARVQFTPDLMPTDILGVEVLEDGTDGTRKFKFQRGPVFASLLLADEINRASPRTQSALLQAMQERRVTITGKNYELPKPFVVLATQNPIEQEGTYPLPEAQLDRFMFNIRVEYPSSDEELEIMQRTTGGKSAEVETVLDGPRIRELQALVREVPIADDLIRYALRLTRATRVKTEEAPDFVKRHVDWGAGPRAGQYLVLGAKASAVLSGRPHVTAEDIRRVALPVLRHRIVTNFAAEAEGVTSDDIIRRLLEETAAHAV